MTLDEQVSSLQSRIHAGGRNVARFFIKPVTSVQNLKDILREFELEESDFALEELTQKVATQCLATLIHKDMAYSYEHFPMPEAQMLAEEAITLLGKNAKFYSNSNWKNGKLESWYPLTKATFDSGVISVSREYIGCIWFEDED